jgi:elongation factor G
LRKTFTGDTLCDSNKPILLETIRFPEPVISVAIEPRSKTDQDKMGEALAKLAVEDPTFKMRHDPDTGQTIISGMGELHLEIIADRLLHQFGVGAKVGKPQVACKETISQPARAEGRFIKQFGGRGQFGHVWIELKPGERGSGFRFTDRIQGGSIPKEFVPDVEKGIREAMKGGVLAGYPLTDIEVTLYDGSFHEVDSSNIAFEMAGRLALREGALKANPILLEPIMKVNVIVPEQSLGDIINDLNSRRAHIDDIETRGDMRVVSCFIPLGETFGYATSVRSLSQGRATHTMEFFQYQEMPQNVAQQIIAKVKGPG